MARSIKSRFRNVIVCEDVRTEVRNKHTLVGVYSGNISVASFPAQFNLAFYVDYWPEEIGNERVDVKIDVNKEEVFVVEGELDVVNLPGAIAIVTPRVLFQFESESEVKILASINKGKFIRIASKLVHLGEVKS